MKYMMFVATDPDAEPYDADADNAEEWVAKHDAAGKRLTGDRLRPARTRPRFAAGTVRCW